MPINSIVLPALYCTSFKVSGLILRAFIHFELIFVQDKKHGPSFIFVHTGYLKVCCLISFLFEYISNFLLLLDF
jgi:hypothetical protein